MRPELDDTGGGARPEAGAGALAVGAPPSCVPGDQYGPAFRLEREGCAKGDMGRPWDDAMGGVGGADTGIVSWLNGHVESAYLQ